MDLPLLFPGLPFFLGIPITLAVYLIGLYLLTSFFGKD